MSLNRRNIKRKHSGYKIIATRKSTRHNENQNEFAEITRRRSTNLRSLHKRRSAQISQDPKDILDKSAKHKKRKVNVIKTKVGRATIPITPQMIHGAVKELQTQRVFINSTLIRNHLRRNFPIERTPEALKAELNEKLNCAVCVGLIAKCGVDKYCLPTLRQQANTNKTAISAFWERYNKNKPRSTENLTNCELPRPKVRVQHRDNVRSRSNNRNYRCNNLYTSDIVNVDSD